MNKNFKTLQSKKKTASGEDPESYSESNEGSKACSKRLHCFNVIYLRAFSQYLKLGTAVVMVTYVFRCLQQLWCALIIDVLYHPAVKSAQIETLEVNPLWKHILCQIFLLASGIARVCA